MPDTGFPSVPAPQQNAASDPSVFGLARPAFDTCVDDEFFFPSDQHLRALDFMGHLLWTRAKVGVVTASHGCGKSLLINRILADLDERIVVAAVGRENLGPREFLLEVLRQYGFSLDEHDKTDRRRMLERFLNHQASMGRVCLLIVENAQQMHPTVLEELRRLAALEVEGARVLKVLLLGQPALNRVLNSPRMADVMTGGVSRFSLEPLSEDQTAAYVAHRLRAAGASSPDELMPHTLMPRIHAVTGGVPLRINQLCEKALTCAASDSASGVTLEALNRATVELGWPQLPVVRTRAIPTSATADTGHEARLVLSMQGMPDRQTPIDSGRMLIGRGEEAEVRIDSVFVSRYHALLVRHEGQDLLLDLGSTNGLLINSRRIVRRVLKDNDVIQIGPAKLTYLNPLAVPPAHPDPGETICFARPGFPAAAGEDDGTGTVIAFGRIDPTISGGR